MSLRAYSSTPDAEPYAFDGALDDVRDGGSVGVLLCHGFTGSPQSMRPWADYLVERGYPVRLPLLPGHGTTWQDLGRTRWPDWYAAAERSYQELSARCDSVFVMGLSMGGTLALRLAEQHGASIAGLVLVNPSLRSDDFRLRFVALLKHLVATSTSIGSDIKQPGVAELAYKRTPLEAVDSLKDLWRVTVADLARVTQPLLVFRSAIDHVVSARNTELLLARVSSAHVEEQVLHESYHVATLDNDAPRIFAGSVEFMARVSTTAAAG